MRMLPLLVALPLWAAPALAQPPLSAPHHPAATQSVSPAPTGSTTPARHHTAPWERQFARANTSHDGHLTLAQAIRGYITVARHFKAIDTDHKGYVTVEDLRAWHRRRREARHRRARHASARAHARPATNHRSSMRTSSPKLQGIRPNPDAPS